MPDRLKWTKIALGAAILILIGYWLIPYFAGTKIINPAWLTLGSFSFYWYGLLMSVAIMVGFWLAFTLNRRILHLDPDQLFYLLIVMIISAFLGARILFVILKWPFYSIHLNEIWQIHSGGMSLHGGLLGGLIGLWAGSRSTKISLWTLTDLCAVIVPLGQAIGRFGNFFNSEAYGGPTALPWKMYVAPQFRPEGMSQFSFYHPTFLYEAIGDLIIFGLLWQWFNRHRLPAGSFTLWYLILYSSWRFLMEYFRIDSSHWGWLTIAQWASLAIILVCGILLNRIHRYDN